MKKAEIALSRQTIEERCFGSSILHVNQSDLPELQKRIHDFRRELGAWLESNQNPDSIYAVSLQAFRLDQK